MSLVSSSFSFDGSASSSSSNHMTTTTQGSSGSSLESSPLESKSRDTSRHSRRKRSRRNATKRTIPNNDDPVGACMAKLLNQNPNFDFSTAETNSIGRKRGRTIHHFDWDDSSLHTFRPLFGPQNRYRVQILSKCAWMLLRKFRPHRDIPQVMGQLHSYLFDTPNNASPFDSSIHPYSPNTRFRWTVSILILLACMFVSSGVAFATVYAWRFVTLVGLVSSSLFVDWKEIASLCPTWCVVTLDKLGRFLVEVDRVLLLGNRYRGREWNKAEFDFTDSMHLFHRPQSGAKDQYLWRLPPPETLTRSSKQVPINDGVTPKYSNTSTNDSAFDEPNQNNQWGELSRRHIEAIDYCYIMLREEFIQKQYSKLKRMRSSFDDTIMSTSDHEIRQRASTVSSMESFRQEFVLDPAVNNIHLDEIDQVTGISTKLQEMLENAVSFDDMESNVVVDVPAKNFNGIHAIRQNGDSESVGSGSDGTAIDMNWMDVGTEIGMKLLASSAVQKAIVADHTYEKIGILRDKMDNHFKQESSESLEQGSKSSSRPATPFFDVSDGGADFDSPTTERPSIHTELAQRASVAVPVNPMWTSAAAAASPAHSLATTATFGTKDDSILSSSPVGIPSPSKFSSSPVSSLPVIESKDEHPTETTALPTIEIIAVSPTPRNSNKTAKVLELPNALPNIPAVLTKKKKRKKKPKTIDPAIELVQSNDEDRKQLIPQLAPPSAKSRIPMLLPGVKIAVPLFPITPDDPYRRPSSRKIRKERYQMATVVRCKRICVYEKNNMPQSGNRGTNCLSITVNLDKSFLRNGQFATMTLRIMDRWGPKYMPKHSKLPMGSCVATSFGLGVLVGWRVEDDVHIVRSLWQRRGSGSACAYLRRDSIHATVEAAVGFEAKTTRGEGTVVGYVHGGPEFKCGRYLVDVKEEGTNKKQMMELIRSDVLSCESAKFIPIVEHIRAAAQYQLQIDRYRELHEVHSSEEETTTRMFGEFSKHFDILWSSFLKAIDENQDFDDGMNEFIQKCVSFLDQLDAPTPVAQSKDDSFDGSIVIHSVDSKDLDCDVIPNEEDKPDSGFWLMNNMFDIFNPTKDDATVVEEKPVTEALEIQFTPRHQRRSEQNYARAYAIIRTLTRTVTNAKAASADEPGFKIILNVCHEILLFLKTVIMVQQKNMNHESLEIWRGAWHEVVSVFGPLQKRAQKVVEGIAERMEKHGRKAKARLLRFVDIIVQDETLFTALEEGDWTRCGNQFERAVVQAKIIDEQSREHYRKTAQFIYKHFSSATSKSDDAAARNNKKVEGLLKVIQVFANPWKVFLELFLQESVLEMMERILVRAFSKDELASQMLNIHCANFQSIRRFRMLKDFTVAGKLWLPLLDAADEEFSWAVSKLPANAQEYLSPISSLFSLCVVQFHTMDVEGDLTKDWLNFMMEDEAATIIHALDMKLILALEQFSRDVNDTMVVLPYYPSIDVDILNLVDELNVDEFVKEASSALDDEDKFRAFIKEKATILVERFLDYLPKVAIPVEKRDLGEGWTLTCRGAGGGDLTLSELVVKREHLICQVLGGDALFFPSSMDDLEVDTSPTLADGATRYIHSPMSNPSSPIKIIEETSILDVIKDILVNARNEGCCPDDGGVANDPYAATVLGNIQVSAVLNCAIDLWRDLEIDDDELLEVAIRDVSYQLEQKDKQQSRPSELTSTRSDPQPTIAFSSSSHDLRTPKNRFNPRVDPTVLFLEIQKLTFNLENFLFRIEKHEAKRTIFDPVFEGKGSILVKNVLIKLRVQCFKGYCAKQVGRKTKQVPYPSLQLVDLDVSLEQVKLLVKDTGADWLLNKIVDGFGDKFSEIISANLCEQVRTQAEEALGNLNGYFEENPEVLLGVLDISMDDLDELTVFV